MKHLFVPYELALKLKEKGFDEKCLGFYYNPKKIFSKEKDVWELEILNFFKPSSNSELEEINTFTIAAPLYQQVIDWLALKGIAIERRWYSSDKIYKYWIERKNGTFVSQSKDKAIEEALKLIP